MTPVGGVEDADGPGSTMLGQVAHGLVGWSWSQSTDWLQLGGLVAAV